MMKFASVGTRVSISLFSLLRLKHKGLWSSWFHGSAPAEFQAFPFLAKRLAVAALFVCLLSSSEFFAQTLWDSVTLSDSGVIKKGEVLFAQNCSVGYCHGVGGKSGRGPRLRGREWDKNYLYKVTLEGIPNSSMPAWRGRLNETEIASIVAYVLTLSKVTSDSAEPLNVPVAPSVPSAPLPAASKIPVSPESTVTGSLVGDPEKGRALFFDSTNDFNCGACHKANGIGSDAGPDLATVRDKPPREILIDIVLPSASLSTGKPFLKLTTQGGEQVQAILIEETPTHLRVYDVESLPPVSRTLPKSQIQTRQAQSRSPMPEKYAEMFTVKQLIDIIAFLKSSPGAAARVSLSDLR